MGWQTALPGTVGFPRDLSKTLGKAQEGRRQADRKQRDSKKEERRKKKVWIRSMGRPAEAADAADPER